MGTVWFLLLAAMITAFVVLDGFDLGAGALHLFVARTEEEREQVTEAIGPVWNGNEVWLIASGGVLFLAFPAVYAASFSGLYFGLILVLWLLIGRGLSLELRHQLENPLWKQAWDVVFALSSATLALVFGVALGNIVRGVPLNSHGFFELPLFNILNWYALLVGVFGLVVLAAHGASLLAFRTTGAVRERARRIARRLWYGEAVLFAGLALPTHAVHSDQLTRLTDHPWTLVFPAIAIAALGAMLGWQRRCLWERAFLASSAFIIGLLTTMAAGLYPDVLRGREGNPHSLTVHNAAAGDHALQIALIWWPIGITLAVVWFFVAYRLFFRKLVR
jgi:cytochrome bd ubiquinol oxidase subunit II